MGEITHGISVFLRPNFKVRFAREELAPDRIVRRLDQVAHRRRYRHGILRRDLFQRRQTRLRNETGVGQRLGASECLGGRHVVAV